MSYMLLVAEPVGQRAERTQAEGKELYDRMSRYAEELREQGLLIACESLATGGVRVKKRDGRASLTDGPFAEAKEMIGGFYLLSCESKEQAIDIARGCPAAEWCEVEVRKVGPCWE